MPGHGHSINIVFVEGIYVENLNERWRSRNSEQVSLRG